MKTVILDRDGVINYDSPEYIKSPAEWQPIPGSLEAIARLNQAGWRVLVATNQSGVARGLYSMQTLNAIHKKFHLLLAQQGGYVDAIFICPHGPDDNCSCRKPKAGLFYSALQRFELTAERTHAVGDSLRDLEAAATAQCQPWLVRTGNGVKTEHMVLPANTQVVDNLATVVDILLKGG